MRSTTGNLPEAMQPIMCCLGERVAGKPTQFMWERAIAAGQLDWRAITIQLSSQDLPVALAGMYVMRIMGLRFYPSLQSSALEQLAGDQTRLQFIGRITSAVRGPENWLTWHNWGSAILAWSSEQAELKNATCWLHGDSVECRSFWVALLEGVAAGIDLPGTVLWSEPPANLTPRWKTGAAVQLIELESAEQGFAHVQELLGIGALAEDSQGKNGLESTSPGVLLLVGDQLPGWKSPQGPRGDPEPLGLAANLAGSAVHVLVAGGALAIQQANSWAHPSLHIMSPAEQMVASEAYDFERWTGCPVSSHVLRDAYDEYHGFE